MSARKKVNHLSSNDPLVSCKYLENVFSHPHVNKAFLSREMKEASDEGTDMNRPYCFISSITGGSCCASSSSFIVIIVIVALFGTLLAADQK